MIQIFYILIVILLTACGTTNAEKNAVVLQSDKIMLANQTPIITTTDTDTIEDVNDYDYATYFVVVVDTNFNYSVLQKKMIHLNSKLKIPIDTMGRYYNKSKNLIALPDNDEDELYAGEYFPRRFPSDNLSLEYLDIYQSKTRKKTIALVSGIYETEKSADSVLSILRKTEQKAFKIKSNIFVGCLR